MSGIGSVLNMAKDALLTQQHAISVVAHNITNVNTEGYSRQDPVLAARDAAPYGGFMFGRGVELGEIFRLSDNLIEERLQQRESDFTALYEKEIYLNVMEGIFSESSGLSLSNQMTEFWAAWNDLSNNPSGIAERSVLYENGALLAQSFNDISSALSRMTIEMSNGIDAGIEQVNQLLSQIADINGEITNIEINSNANDLRDQRNMLVRKLSDFININTFEDDDGTMTVMTGKGFSLVNKRDAYSLSFSGTDVIWNGANSTATITDVITGGKMGGWLDMRDEIIPKYQADFDELAKGIVYELNKIHTQGVGLTGFTSLTGTYAATDNLEELGTVDSGLDYYDKIVDGTFEIWLYDSTGAVVGSETITIDADPAGTTLTDLRDALELADTNIGTATPPGDLTATITAGQLVITAANGYTFAFSDDTSNVLAALGLNTFFTGTDAGSMAANSVLDSQKGMIAAAKVDSATGAFVTGDNSNALDVAGLQFQGVDLLRYTYTRGSSPTTETITGTTLDTFLHTLVSSVGIKSLGIKRETAYSEVIVDQMKQTRDSISAVSLDEEMTNITKYQQAYSAVAKLISVSDEMLSILLAVK